MKNDVIFERIFNDVCKAYKRSLMSGCNTTNTHCCVNTVCRKEENRRTSQNTMRAKVTITRSSLLLALQAASLHTKRWSNELVQRVATTFVSFWQTLLHQQCFESQTNATWLQTHRSIFWWTMRLFTKESLYPMHCEKCLIVCTSPINHRTCQTSIHANRSTTNSKDTCNKEHTHNISKNSKNTWNKPTQTLRTV